MNEMKQLMTELTDRLRKTNEYNQYINVLSRLKQDPELYARIGDYRRRSLWIQMQEGEALFRGIMDCRKILPISRKMALLMSFCCRTSVYRNGQRAAGAVLRRFGSGNILLEG